MQFDLAIAIRRFVVYDTQLSDWFDEGDVYFHEPPEERGGVNAELPYLLFTFMPSGNPDRGFDGGRVESVRVQFTVYHDDHFELLQIIDLLSDELDRNKLAFESGSTRKNLSVMALAAALVRSHGRGRSNEIVWSATRDFVATVQV